MVRDLDRIPRVLNWSTTLACFSTRFRDFYGDDGRVPSTRRIV